MQKLQIYNPIKFLRTKAGSDVWPGDIRPQPHGALNDVDDDGKDSVEWWTDGVGDGGRVATGEIVKSSGSGSSTVISTLQTF